MGIKDLKEIITLNKDTVLGDIILTVLKPAAEVIGKTLKTTLELIVLPFEWLTEEGKKLLLQRLEEFSVKKKHSKKENLCDINPQIGVPVLQRLTYITSDEIADLFTSLLASASDETTKGEVHPSFIGIIDSLSADEALIIKYFKETQFRDIPFSSVRAYKTKNGGFETKLDHVTNIPTDVDDLLFPENIGAYLSNLVRLGILVEPPGLAQKDRTEYHEIEKRPEFKKLKSKLGTTYEDLKYKRGYYSVTPFGQLFIKMVVPDADQRKSKESGSTRLDY